MEANKKPHQEDNNSKELPQAFIGSWSGDSLVFHRVLNYKWIGEYTMFLSILNSRTNVLIIIQIDKYYMTRCTLQTYYQEDM